MLDTQSKKTLLYSWLKIYTNETINKVMKKEEEIFKDKTTIRILQMLNKEITNDSIHTLRKIEDYYNATEEQKESYEIDYQNNFSKTNQIREILYQLHIKED